MPRLGGQLAGGLLARRLQHELLERPDRRPGELAVMAVDGAGSKPELVEALLHHLHVVAEQALAQRCGRASSCAPGRSSARSRRSAARTSSCRRPSWSAPRTGCRHRTRRRPRQRPRSRGPRRRHGGEQPSGAPVRSGERGVHGTTSTGSLAEVTRSVIAVPARGVQRPADDGSMPSEIAPSWSISRRIVAITAVG